MHDRLVTVLEELPRRAFEIVYVDDGSRDDTLDILRELHRNDVDRVAVVALSRNFGHQIAATAGLENARGDAVVVIDADLQDPPEVILEMLERWRDGVDVVYGVRTERRGERASRLWLIKLFYRVMNRLSDVEIPVDSGDFRLLDRKIVDSLMAMPEKDRYVRGMVSWVGFRQEPLYYRREARAAGRSKYPLGKLIRLAADGILSFSRVPLRLAVYMGLGVAGLSVVGIVYALAVRLFTERWVTGWAFLIISILFLGGVQLIFLGVIGEYLGRVFGEVKRRPLYFVRERLSPGDAE
jgi:dolichol-phosphate mannosyltransferase